MVSSVNLPTPDVGEIEFGAEELTMARYREEGTRRALELDNRGPARFGPDGRLLPEIVESYIHHGFYIFEGVVSEEERADIERDVAHILDRAPMAPDSKLDCHANPALGADCEGATFRLVRPLSDPFGGTNKNHGRHQIKMAEPKAPAGAPAWGVQGRRGPRQSSAAGLRYYAHPPLLPIAVSINGEDFAPFNESIWVKHPRLGGSVSLHQDGWTHWESPDLHWGTDIWVVNVDEDGHELTQITSNEGRDYSPAWSLDGRSIAYVTSTGYDIGGGGPADAPSWP